MKEEVHNKIFGPVEVPQENNSRNLPSLVTSSIGKYEHRQKNKTQVTTPI